jgi:signal peptidase I
MEPTLFKGDLVFTSNKKPGDIKTGFYDGDIVIIDGPKPYYEQGFDPLFWFGIPNNTHFCHRVVDKKEINGTWYFLTRGDNSIWLYDGKFHTLNKTENYLLFEFNSSNLIYISEQYILGVVSFKLPFIGYLKNFSIFLLIGIISLLILPFIIKTFKTYFINLKKHRFKLLSKKKVIGIIALLLVSAEIGTLLLTSNFFIMDRSNMAPTLRVGDLLITEQKEADKIEVNDLVLIKGPDYYYKQGFDPLFWGFLPNNTVFVSRILDKKIINGTHYFLTCQDNGFYPINGMFRTLISTENYSLYEYNTSNCIYIPENAILEVVTSKIPFVGAFHYYCIAGVTLLCVIVIVDVTQKRKRSKR